MTIEDGRQGNEGALAGDRKDGLTAGGLGSTATPSTAEARASADAEAEGRKLEALVAGGALGFVQLLARLPTSPAQREAAIDDLQAGALLFFRRKADDFVRRRGEGAVIDFRTGKPASADAGAKTARDVLANLGAAAATLRGEFGPEAVKLFDFAERLHRYRTTLDLVEYLAGKLADPAAAGMGAIAGLAQWALTDEPASDAIGDLFAERALDAAAGLQL